MEVQKDGEVSITAPPGKYLGTWYTYSGRYVRGNALYLAAGEEAAEWQLLA
jgi:hypothetical protein